MSRVSRSTLLVLAATVSLMAVTSAAAQAKVFHVTGTQTTITPTSQVAGFLASHQVTVSAIGPATISGGAVTLPIAGGFVTKSTNGGLLRHTGGLKFTVGSRSVAVTHFVLIAHKVHGRLLAWVGGRRITVARLINASRTVSGKTGTLTGELTLSAAAAHKINKRLGKHIVTGGTELGALSSSVTVA
jgi:hypothetical protein